MSDTPRTVPPRSCKCPVCGAAVRVWTTCKMQPHRQPSGHWCEGSGQHYDGVQKRLFSAHERT
jgi:hypothetical protein